MGSSFGRNLFLSRKLWAFSLVHMVVTVSAISSALLLVLPCWLDDLRWLPGTCDVAGRVWMSVLGGIALFGYFFGEEEFWLVLGSRSMELGEYMMFVYAGEE